MKLRDYQTDLVRELSYCYTKKNIKAVMLQLATGGGKTRTAVFVVDKYAKSGRQVLWLVHREELLTQAAMTFSEIGVPHRLICAKSSERAIKAEEFREFGQSYVFNNAKVIICSIQTLVRRIGKPELDWLQPSQIIADEAHLSLNATFRKIIGHYEARLLGLTATPTRLDGQDFRKSHGGLYERLIQGISVGELMDQGSLADYVLYEPPVSFQVPKKKHKIKGGDYDGQSLQTEFESGKVYGDVIHHYLKYSAGKPAIGFCPTIAVAQKMAEEFCAAGLKAVSIDGETDDIKRRRALKDLGEGKIDVVFNVNILIEGTDVPYATTCLLLRRTKSLVIYLQSIGRVLRPHPDKEKAIILDFVGLAQEHGYPDDDRIWCLSGKPRRKPNKDGSEPEIKIQKCPHCFAKHKPALKCPACGHEYTTAERKGIEVVACDLEDRRSEIREQKRLERMQEKKQRGFEESKCETLEDWVNLAKSRNYKFPVHWAKRRYGLRKKGANTE